MLASDAQPYQCSFSVGMRRPNIESHYTQYCQDVRLELLLSLLLTWVGYKFVPSAWTNKSSSMKVESKIAA